MRRVISFILVLVFMLSLACTAFAAVDSIPNDAPGSDGNDGSEDGGNGSAKTGDMIRKWIVLLVASLLALIAVVVIYCKKFA